MGKVARQVVEQAGINVNELLGKLVRAADLEGGEGGGRLEGHQGVLWNPGADRLSIEVSQEQSRTVESVLVFEREDTYSEVLTSRIISQAPEIKIAKPDDLSLEVRLTSGGVDRLSEPDSKYEHWKVGGPVIPSSSSSPACNSTI